MASGSTVLREIAQMMVQPGDSMRDVMLTINRSLQGLALVVDGSRRLLGTISDGDVRRAILSGHPLDTTAEILLEAKRGTPREKPVVAGTDVPDDQLVRMMTEQQISLIPIVDGCGRVLRVATLNEFVKTPLPIQAVIMAGGFGKRLRPLTDDTPKPMLPIAGRPLMERMIERLREAGVRSINVTTHFMPEKIENHFGDGAEFGVNLTYVAEREPLGTAGSLSLMQAGDEPILVMNGDILTDVDFRAFVEFHKESGAQLTVGVRQYEMGVPYGVIEAQDGRVKGLREKPTLGFLVSAGIYLLEPTVHSVIPEATRFDMTDLIEALLTRGDQVACFPIVEYWLDIGHHDDFRRAQDDLTQMRRVA